jgi:hypothetical protein
MNRTTAVILTIASILLCGCPGLAACAVSVYAMTLTPQSLANLFLTNGIDPSTLGDPNVGLWGARIVWAVIALVLIAIPIIIGLVTLRRAKKAVL